MIEVSKSMWLRVCERGFTFCFVAFSFVMFSCWFPTGFSSTFSTLAFFFALPICVRRLNLSDMLAFEKVGLMLFAWIALSITWSEVTLLENIQAVSEYRIFFITPVMGLALATSPETIRYSGIAAVVGASIALISSYGLGFEWWEIKGARFSLANRIYHGFIMAMLLLACLIVAIRSHGFIRLSALVVSALVFFNVLGIENGRTGYILIAAVSSVVAIKIFRWQHFIIFAFIFFIALGSLYFFNERFNASVVVTLSDISNALNGRYSDSSGVSLRIQYYIGAISVISNNFYIGVGVGEVASSLRELNAYGFMPLTDNVHNEYLNIFMGGGLISFILYFIYWILLFVQGARSNSNKDLAFFIIGVVIIAATAGIFNSVIKDYGEKHALIVVISIISALLRRERSGFS